MTRVESYSSLATLASCAEKYRLSYVERLEEPETVAQTNGKAMHAAANVLYVGGFDAGRVEAAKEAALAAWGETRSGLASKKPWLTKGFLEARIEAYVEERTRRPTMLEEAEVVAAYAEEMHVFDWSGPRGLVRVRGMPDLVVRSGGKTFVVDHKFPTSGYLTDFYFLRFSLGFQLRIYAAMYQNLTGEVVAGGFINAVSCGEKSVDPPEKWKTRKSAPSALRRIDFTQEQIADAHVWADGLLRQRDFHASVGLWPRNEAGCDDMGGCAYVGLCAAPSEGVRKAMMMTGFKRKEEEER